MSDLDHIVYLIKELYAPCQTSETILNTQKQLQIVQKQPNSNIVAHQLLQHDETNIQFFGALTYTVYITNNPVTLELANQISEEIVDACRRDLQLLVIQKLLSNMAKIYSKIFYNPLDYILNSLENRLNFDIDQTLVLALLSSKSIPEELLSSKISLTTEQVNDIINNIFKITTINILDNSIPHLKGDDRLTYLWLNCIESWLPFINYAFFDFHIVIDINNYLSIVIDLLINDLDDTALAILCEIYDTNTKLINEENKLKLDGMIFSNWYREFIERKDIDDVKNLSKLFTLYLELNLLPFAQYMLTPKYALKFKFILSLTNLYETPVLADSFSVSLLDFWIPLTEDVLSQMDSYSSNIEIETFFMILADNYWKKSRLIVGDEFVDDEDDFFDLTNLEEFLNYRRDVAELFESLYSINKSVLFGHITSKLITALDTKTEDIEMNCLKNIEASLFCLHSIAFILNENNVTEDFYQSMDKIFSCNLLKRILEVRDFNKLEYTRISKKFKYVPFEELFQYLVKMTIKFLSEIKWYYQTNNGKKYIKDILIFLFNFLNVDYYRDVSSKAILQITDSCRYELSELLNDFEASAHTMFSQKYNIDSTIRSRITRSYANILQTVKEPQLQAQKISNFLDLMYNEVQLSYNLINGNINNKEVLENIDNFLLSVISCLVGLAKGLKIPEDWEEYYLNNNRQDEMINNFNYWNNIDKNEFKVHEKCLKLIDLFSFPNEYINDLKVNKLLNSEIMEEIYLFFKAGLTEPLSGPFVIDSNLILTYILKCCKLFQQKLIPKHINPPIIKIIELYGVLIKSNILTSTISKISGLDIKSIDLKVPIVVNEIFLKPIHQVIKENDILTAEYTLFADIISTYPKYLIQDGSIIVKIMSLSIEQFSINCQDRFVIIAMAKFWTNLIYLRKGKLEDIHCIKNILINEKLGISLVYSLIKGFLNTSRSIIEFYSDILRSLINKFSKDLKNWLILTFDSINKERIFNGKEKIDEKEIELFIKQLLITRGQRSANEIIKKFWLNATSMVDYGM
ncbi:Kap122 protein [Pichia kluyveri]|uniref:Kap122 protein n=1 Tax=Pichia kluyveri TaxID=36015 RepID=A0AAV5R261_PICKL|nr:Kap122 protein [Pichia kluyveri]